MEDGRTKLTLQTAYNLEREELRQTLMISKDDGRKEVLSREIIKLKEAGLKEGLRRLGYFHRSEPEGVELKQMAHALIKMWQLKQFHGADWNEQDNAVLIRAIEIVKKGESNE